MKKELLLSLLLASATPTIFAQMADDNPEAKKECCERPQAPASTFQQVDKIRKALNLDQKQFEKVYKAYETYNKAIFGDSNQAAPSGMRGGGPRGGMGGPGGGMGGPGGGMGGPGGGMGGPGGGMGGPGGDMGAGNGGERPNMAQGQGSRQEPPKEMSEKDMEKMHKKMQKQETKLTKSVRKAIKDDATFAKWQEMRQQELMPPKHDK